MRKENEFRNKMTVWANQNGFNPIYSDNHPTEHKDRIDFVGKNFGMRICFVKEYNSEYFYFNQEVYINNSILTLKTGKHSIERDLDKIYILREDMMKAINKIHKKTLIEKLKIIFKKVQNKWKN